MELKLDGEIIEVTESDNDTLRSVVDRVSELLRERNRVISEILVDGVPTGGWDDPNIASRTTGECNSMTLISEEPRNLAYKVLYEIAGYMPQVQNALVETSSKIQARNEQEGLLLLQQITQTWAELLQGIQSAITVTGVDLDSVMVEGRTFIDVNEEIHSFLEEISTLVEGQQWLELSDILEYELAPRIPKMEEGIYQVIKVLEHKPH